MAKKVGTLIKEARTNAGLTQEQLAKKIKNLTANEISKAERGEKELTQEQLKAIAKATGVTQKSLLEAAKGSSSKASTTSSSKTTKTSTASKTSISVTAQEKKLVELYRLADSDTKKSVMAMLKKNEEATSEVLENIISFVKKMSKESK